MMRADGFSPEREQGAFADKDKDNSAMAVDGGLSRGPGDAAKNLARQRGRFYNSGAVVVVVEVNGTNSLCDNLLDTRFDCCPTVASALRRISMPATPVKQAFIWATGHRRVVFSGPPFARWLTAKLIS
jgi:hypothetical protein